MGKNAFLTADGILKAWGYVETNEATDTKIPVADDFNLPVGEWRWDGLSWVAIPEPQ